MEMLKKKKRHVYSEYYCFSNKFSYFRCSIEDDIMGQFQYSANKTTAVVNFQAHKFPYTTSVYYQCHVHLCLKANGGCVNTVHLFFKVYRRCTILKLFVRFAAAELY